MKSFRHSTYMKLLLASFLLARAATQSPAQSTNTGAATTLTKEQPAPQLPLIALTVTNSLTLDDGVKQQLSEFRQMYQRLDAKLDLILRDGLKVTALPRTNWTVTSLDEESKSLVRTATESHWYTSRPFASLMAALLGIIGTITGYTLRTRADLKKDRQLANAVVRTITSEVDIWFEYLKKGIAGDVERLGPDEALRIRFQLQQNFFVIFDSNAGSLSKAGKDTCSHVIQIYMRGKSLFEYLAINNRLLDDPNANPRVLQKHAEFIKDIWANLKQDYAKLKTVVIQ